MLVKALLIVAAFAAHECGHILAARWFGVPIRKVGLSGRGPHIRRARTTGWPEILICLAGPAANLALAVAFAHRNPWFMLCNATFCWFNLLPIAHSDGGHALEAFFDMRWKRLVDRVGNTVEAQTNADGERQRVCRPRF